jgi:hypothetical protein
MADRKSIDEQFSDSYRTDPRTLQPSVGGVKQVRNVQTGKDYDPNKRRGGSSTQSSTPSTDQNLENQTRQVDVQNQTDGVRSVAVEQSQSINQGRTRARQTFQKTGKSLVRRKKITATKVAGRLAARAVTVSIWSWAFWIWMWFQVPFAIVSILFMGLTEAIYQFSLTVQPDAEGSFAASAIAAGVAKVTAFLLNTVAAVVDAVMELTLGFKLSDLNPANFFMMTHVLVMLMGWGTLLAIGIIYTISAQKSFSGRGASGKNAMFLVALIGYSIPILNLFPWFFLWTLMVLKNPR